MMSPSHFRRFWIFTAVVVIFQLAFVQAMAASGELHHHFHDHAEDSGHHCAVTMLLNGGFDVVVPEILPVEIVQDPPQVVVETPVRIAIQPSHLAGGVLAHAPPRGP